MDTMIETDPPVPEGFHERINAFLRDVRGVIHVGANTGQERDRYAAHDLPVFWVEALPEAHAELCAALRDEPKQRAAQALVAETDGRSAVLHRSNNGGRSSSIFPLGRHRDIWPSVQYEGDLSLVTETLPTVLRREKADLDRYDTLILDVQGAELLVLQGAEDLLDRLRFVRCEMADFALYEGACVAGEVDAFLREHGYECLETVTRSETPGIGRTFEALYERREARPVRIGAVMSTPRLGFLANADCVLQAIAVHGIPLARGEGAFWHHSLTRGIEKQLEDPAIEYILTIDYDVIFTAEDVARLVVALCDHPHMDAVAAMLQKREGGELVATSRGAVDLTSPVVPITQGHFGLTLFRRRAFEKLAKPWFYEAPNEAGEWNENRTDADIGFWANCERSGVEVGLALDVVAGHLELVVTWPDVNLRPLFQTMNAYHASGKQPPAGAFRRLTGARDVSLEMGG